jgi:hypothetical protein
VTVIQGQEHGAAPDYRKTVGDVSALLPGETDQDRSKV